MSNAFPGSITYQLIVREIESRYRGSVLGVLWSFLTPLFMLAIFTFVFAVVFRARWGGSTETSLTEYALILFAGLTAFSLFSEVFGRAPMLVTSQPNLVKKVVFPLHVLAVVALGSALFQAGISFAVLIAFQVTIGSGFHWPTLLVPFLIVPLCLFTLGVAWFLSSLGVYVRDVGQIIPPVVTALMFLSPIFYPVTALPEWIRPVASYSPIAYSVETVRDAMIFGRLPEVVSYLVALAGGLAVAGLGFAFFQKTRKGFADVL
ncbi:sugar ABC transporter permease [Phreatobacter cathodiphilus]|uniref:Transport permease protein n=1 Tax=Phreatobacter cathodiphilus TaxID=1868589 RepID=A0A2S0NBK0_9HYPH|nr:sugar ABC transporter permease [Phreatobacter cathodiphilus]